MSAHFTLIRLKERYPGAFKDSLGKRRRMIFVEREKWSLPRLDLGTVEITNFGDAIAFDESEIVNDALMSDRGISPATCILLLAACGIQVILPNVMFSKTRSEEFFRLKESLKNLPLAA